MEDSMQPYIKKHWLTGKSFKAKGLYLPIYIQTPLTLPFLPRRGTGKAALAKCPSALPIYLQKNIQSLSP